jgi:hypothetical protein
VRGVEGRTKDEAEDDEVVDDKNGIVLGKGKGEGG